MLTSQPRLSYNLVKQKQLAEPALRDPNIAKQIVHLGLGAFHRAHQAMYTELANLKALSENQNEDLWKIIGVSLRSENVQQQLQPQDNYYTLTQTGSEENECSLVSVIHQVLVAPIQSKETLDALNSEHTHIVSLTITEKGYCHNPASGDLNIEHPDIINDIAAVSGKSTAGVPKTAIALIVCSLQTRFQQKLKSFTVLCCDNLPENGATLAKIIYQFAMQIDPKLAAWIQQKVSFPNTMVDRIVPATTEQDIEQLAHTQQFVDHGMVKTERFSQWVIEDNFVSDRPRWEDVGANVVSDVHDFEKAKLRFLNGAHSSLAYLAYLSGYEYVHEVTKDSSFMRFLRHLMQHEILPTVKPPQGLDLHEYIEDLLKRFANPSLNHRTYQIAMDGSQKMPQRLLHTIEERIASEQSIDALCFAVAGWLRYTMGFDQKGDPIEVQDPIADELLAIQQTHFYQIDDLVNAYVNCSNVFSQTLQGSSVFKQKLTYWLGAILANGVSTALQILLLELDSAYTEVTDDTRGEAL